MVQGHHDRGADEVGGEPLIGAITTFLRGQDAQTLADIRASLAREIDRAGPDALASLCRRLAGAGADWHHYPRDPLALRIHEVIAERILGSESILRGREHLAAVDGRPVVIVANHLSYSDANVLDILLRRAGAIALSDRLTVVAGPKVYSNLKRRFSSLCFGTIKIPQSRTVSSEDAVMDVREIARGARRSIDIAHERLRLGEALLVFAEGTRSRTGGMQQMLAGVARYLDYAGTLVLPVGITGTEALFPIGDETIHRVPIVAQAGEPLDAGILRQRARRDRRLIMDCVGLAIARLLPPAYRGVYADDVDGLEAARKLLG
jgi:1-acyl-sn-glycerol-3-phosphate acyltransferase